MPQMKAWTAITSLRSRPRIHRRSRDIKSGLDAVITCGEAKITQIHSSSQQCNSNLANTIHKDADVDAGARTSTLPDVRDMSYLSELDPQLTKRAEIQLVPSTHSNVDAVMDKPNYRIHSTVASCLPHEDMWLPCEVAEQVEIPEGTFLERNECFFHNPHDMHVSVPNTQHASKSLEDFRRAEERDKDVLREFFRDPFNIVLHSDCPHIAPHIVITPAQETADDFYTPWMNRTLAQWTGALMVPPCNLATGRLHLPNPPTVPREPDIPCPNGGNSIDEGPQGEDTRPSFDPPGRVFSHSQFSSFVEQTGNERLILYHVAKALQKHQCKAAAYAASARATEFCRRYEAPELLASIEKPFVWTDPAEPLLLSSRHMPGALIFESSHPFIAPHIIINTPPPQNPWIPWCNAVNNPQDGHYLIVPSPRGNYVNTDEEDEEEEDDDEGSLRMLGSSANSSKLFFVSEEDGEDDDEHFADAEGTEDEDDSMMVDHTESPPSSRPGSPGPETPTDDSASMRGFFPSRRSGFVIDEDDEDERALALAIAKNAVEEYYQSASLLRASLPVIEEEDSAAVADDDDGAGFSTLAPPPLSPIYALEEDEGLPPLDDWYLGIASRTMGLAVSVA